MRGGFLKQKHPHTTMPHTYHQGKGGEVGRHFARAKSNAPSVEEQQGGITSLGQNRITAARTVIDCPKDVIVNEEGAELSSNNNMILLAGGLLVVALLLMRQSQ